MRNTRHNRRTFLTGTAALATATLVSGPGASDALAQIPGDGPFEAGDTFAVMTGDGDGVNLRAEPSLSGEVIAVVPEGTAGAVGAGPREADGEIWYGANILNTWGWLSARYMQVWSDDPVDTVQVHDGPLRVHTEPGLSTPVVGSVPTWTTGRLNDEAPQTVDGLEWLNVMFYDADNLTGWVASDYITIVE